MYHIRATGIKNTICCTFCIIREGMSKSMDTLTMKLLAIPLKVRAVEIYVINAILSIVVLQKSLSLTKTKLFLDKSLTRKREVLNEKTRVYFERVCTN